MSLSRHPIYENRNSEDYRTESTVRRFFKATLGFLAASASIFCMQDMLMFMNLTITFTSAIFIGFLGVGLFIGILWGAKSLRDDNKKNDDEATLAAEYETALLAAKKNQYVDY